jgi:hypothetical protein
MVMLSSAGQQNAKRFHEAGFFAVDGQARGARAAVLLNVLQAAMNAAPRTIGDGAAPSAPVQVSHALRQVLFLETTEVTPRRVLLAEDNVVNAKLAVRLLERLGCHVDVASNGHEALKMVQSIPFDLVSWIARCRRWTASRRRRAIVRGRTARGLAESPVYAVADHRAHGECDAGRSRALYCPRA